jgi:hypothetical protein
MARTRQTAETKFSKKEEFDQICADKIERALELEISMKEDKKELEGIKEFFMNLLTKENQIQTLATYKGIATLKTVNGYSVSTVEVPNLKKVFKKNYAEFINEKISYGATAKLKELLHDGDYEFRDVIRKAVIIETNQSVKFEKIKINKPKLAK